MWAPPEHPMVLGRMWFVAVAGAVAVREAYDFLMGVTADIGQSAWIAVAVIITGMVRNTSPTLFLSKFLILSIIDFRLFKTSVGSSTNVPGRSLAWGHARTLGEARWTASTRSPRRVDCVGGNRDRSIRPLLISKTRERKSTLKAFLQNI